MFARRVDDFAGDELAYVGYLYLKATKVPVVDLISQLEDQVERSRSAQPQAPSQPGGQSEDDEGQTRREHESQVNNQRRSQLIDRDVSKSLNIQMWNPNTEYKPPQSSSGSRWWEPRTRAFFNSLPVLDDEWDKKREKVQLSTEDDVLRTVDCLVTGSLGPLKDDKRSPDEESDSAGGEDSGDALSSSAERAAALIKTAKHSKHIAQFFSLVFMAECCVAQFNHCPKETVESAIRKFVEDSGGTCDGDNTPDLFLSTTRWVLREQERQFRRGLLHRGFELFFNAGKSLRFYADCPKSGEQNARFTAKIPKCEVPDEIHASLPLWLPFIVGIRNVHQWSYTTICTALGVTLWSREEHFQKWRETYLSRRLVICRLEQEPQLQEETKKRHHAKKRKKSAEPESRTLRRDSIRKRGTQFRATGAGQHGEPAVSQHDKSLAIRDSSALVKTAPHFSGGLQVTQPTGSAPVAPSNVAGQEYAEQRTAASVPAFGAVEQASSRSSFSFPNGSPPGITGTIHEPPGHGHGFAIASPQNLLDGLRRPSPSNTRANSAPTAESALHGREESGTTIFQPMNVNGLTTSKDQGADELHYDTSGGVPAAQEASPLCLLAGAAAAADEAEREPENQRSAETAPTLGSPRILFGSEQAAGVDGFLAPQGGQIDIGLGGYGNPDYFDFGLYSDAQGNPGSVDNVFNSFF